MKPNRQKEALDSIYAWHAEDCVGTCGDGCDHQEEESEE